MNIPPAVIEAWGSICGNLWSDESTSYQDDFGVDDPADIKTEDLKSSSYKDMRVLDDFINAVWVIFVFFVLVLFCLGARLCSSGRS